MLNSKAPIPEKMALSLSKGLQCIPRILVIQRTQYAGCMTWDLERACDYLVQQLSDHTSVSKLAILPSKVKLRKNCIQAKSDTPTTLYTTAILSVSIRVTLITFTSTFHAGWTGVYSGKHGGLK